MMKPLVCVHNNSLNISYGGYLSKNDGLDQVLSDIFIVFRFRTGRELIDISVTVTVSLSVRRFKLPR